MKRRNMQKYEVHLSCFEDFVVAARDEEEAVEIAEEMAAIMIPVWEVDEVHEIEKKTKKKAG